MLKLSVASLNMAYSFLRIDKLRAPFVIIFFLSQLMLRYHQYLPNISHYRLNVIFFFFSLYPDEVFSIIFKKIIHLLNFNHAKISLL